MRIHDNPNAIQNRILDQRDVKYKRLTYIIFSAFCIAPWLDFDKMELKWQRLNKCYAIFYLTAIIGVLTVTAITRTDPPKEIETILNKLNAVIYIFFLAIVILSSIFLKQRKFVSYIVHMNELELKMATQKRDKFYLYFIFGHIGFIASSIYIVVAWPMEGRSQYLSILDILSVLIPEYYCFIATLGACRIINYLGGKFVELNKLLANQTQNFNENGNQYLDKILHRHISQIGKYYRNILLMMNEFSEIYGGVILLMSWHSIVQTLRFINLLLFKLEKDKDSLELTASLAVMTVWSITESALIFMSCEGATAAGMKIGKTCNRLQHHFSTNLKLRKEFFYLSKLIESHGPTFTAADYFVINKTTILKLIRIISTYVIVIIKCGETHT